jgi:hypothetical protein
MTMFDFNLDGKMEIVYRDEENLRVFDGTSATTMANPLLTLPCKSQTSYEGPVIADIFADGHARILVTCDGGQRERCWEPTGFTDVAKIQVYSAAGQDQWAPARKVWNQYMYNVVNVNEDLTIPQYQVDLAKVYPNGKRQYNAFLQQQPYVDLAMDYFLPLPNLVFDPATPVMTYYPAGDSIVFVGCVTNIGEVAMLSPIYVSYYKNDTVSYSATGIKTEVINKAIMPGEKYCFHYKLTNVNALGATSIWFSFNDNEGLYPYQSWCLNKGRWELQLNPAACPVFKGIKREDIKIIKP